MTADARIFPRFRAFFPLLALSACFISCQDQRASGPMKFTARLAEDVLTWDPARATDESSTTLIAQIYETLYQYAYLEETRVLLPLLASDFPSYDSTRLMVSIPIRSGVFFHPSPSLKKKRELAAADFETAFNRLKQGNTPGKWLFHSKIKGVTATDRFTLRIELREPFPELETILTQPYTAPIAKETEARIHQRPVGTGPFQLKQWSRGREIILERNPQAHPEFFPTRASISKQQAGLLTDAGSLLPFLDEARYVVDPNQDHSWRAFLAGKYDLFVLPRGFFGDSIRQQSNLSPELTAQGIRLHLEPYVIHHHLIFNLSDPVFGKNQALRCRLSQALNRTQWMERFSNGGLTQLATTVVPWETFGVPTPAGFQPVEAGSAPKKSKRKKPVKLRLLIPGDEASQQPLAQFFQAQFAPLGISVQPVYASLEQALDLRKKGKFQMTLERWGLDAPSPLDAYRMLYGPAIESGENTARFKNAQYDAAFEELSRLREHSSPELTLALQQLESVIQKECAWVYGFHSSRYSLSQPWLMNYDPKILIRNKLKYLKISERTKKRYLEE